ncbi:UNVERIFIED_CONTAM: hypothetical protein Sradi_7104700 [Sesamum radiatum]|uniref:Uncharacterized protein n=1 Tax=Sesamum radiatum TaxID=300843 RepID=A0AAW2J0V1_SESRA
MLAGYFLVGGRRRNLASSSRDEGRVLWGHLVLAIMQLLEQVAYQPPYRFGVLNPVSSSEECFTPLTLGKWAERPVHRGLFPHYLGVP